MFDRFGDRNHGRDAFGRGSEATRSKETFPESSVSNRQIEEIIAARREGRSPTLAKEEKHSDKPVEARELARAIIDRRGAPIDSAPITEALLNRRTDSLSTRTIAELYNSFAVQLLHLAEEVVANQKLIGGAEGKDTVTVLKDIEERALLKMLTGKNTVISSDYDKQLADPIQLLCHAGEAISLTNMSTAHANAVTVAFLSRLFAFGSNELHSADTLLARYRRASLEENTFNICSKAQHEPTLARAVQPTLDTAARIETATAHAIGSVVEQLSTRSHLPRARHTFTQGSAAINKKDF